MICFMEIPFLLFPMGENEKSHASASAKRVTSILTCRMQAKFSLHSSSYLLTWRVTCCSSSSDFRRSAVANPIWRLFEWPKMMGHHAWTGPAEATKGRNKTRRLKLPRRSGFSYPPFLDRGQRHLFSPSARLALFFLINCQPLLRDLLACTQKRRNLYLSLVNKTLSSTYFVHNPCHHPAGS